MAEDKEKEAGADGAVEKKYPYPKSVFFIISTEFCERFSFYGMKTVLALFFKQVLNFDQDLSTILYHAFTALCYFTPMLGAIIADSFVGKFRTIFYISIVYALGQIILTIGAIGDTSNGNEGISGLPADAMAYVGLLLIALGTGGIKPCVASFGGEQFKMPEQAHHMKSFFSMFYASINGGSLISTILTPILRQNTACFGQDSCYPLAFGVPAALMIVAILLFLSGRICNLYTLVVPDENIIVKTFKCILFSFKQSRTSKQKKPSFLDHGEKKYGRYFIEDVKALGNVVYMFLPFPIFWALFDQQGSRWTFQATRMNGDTFGFVILPDMMQVSNPVLILAFIPIFDYIIYPILTKFKLLTTPLQRIVAGGILVCLAFVTSGVLEIFLEKSYPDLPEEGKMHFTVYNGFEGCTLGGVGNKNVTMYQKDEMNHINQIYFDFQNASTKYQTWKNAEQGQWYVGDVHVACEGGKTFEIAERKFGTTSPPEIEDKEFDEYEDNAQLVLISLNTADTNKGFIKESIYKERLEKSDTGLPLVKLFWNLEGLKSDGNVTFELQSESGGDPVIFPDPGKPNEDYIFHPVGDTHFEELLKVGKYNLSLKRGDETLFKQELGEDLLQGANYQILLQYIEGQENPNLSKLIVHKITSENELHIFLLLPQFVIMTAGEIMFSITSLQFSFTQAPESMKAVMMAIRMLTNAFGNVIDVVVIALLKDVFDSQVQFFFLFAGLMLLDMLLLGWMATRYTYKDYTTLVRDDLDEKPEKEKGEDN